VNERNNPFIDPVRRRTYEEIMATIKRLPFHRFDEFWAIYPKKVSKQTAFQAWRRIAPDENVTPDQMTDKIIAAVKAHKLSRQWRSDAGKFIPHPTTWLKGRRWEDEIY
jgi:hypothetical protein